MFVLQRTAHIVPVSPWLGAVQCHHQRDMPFWVPLHICLRWSSLVWSTCKCSTLLPQPLVRKSVPKRMMNAFGATSLLFFTEPTLFCFKLSCPSFYCSILTASLPLTLQSDKKADEDSLHWNSTCLTLKESTFTVVISLPDSQCLSFKSLSLVVLHFARVNWAFTC